MAIVGGGDFNMGQIPHKPGPLKQQNKQHKTGRHCSKRMSESATGGKVDAKSVTKRNKRELNKQQRKHQAAQIRKNKREKVIAIKRSVGGVNSAPLVVLVVPLNGSVDTKSFTESLLLSDDSHSIKPIDHLPNSLTFYSSRLKQCISIIHCIHGNNYTVLEGFRICDTVIFIGQASENFSDFGLFAINCVLYLGLPTSLYCVQGLQEVQLKKRADLKKSIQKQLEKKVPKIERLYSVDTASEVSILLANLSSHKQKVIKHRGLRSYIWAQKVEVLDGGESSGGSEMVSESNDCCTLKLTGFVRGRGLSVNQLINLPGAGEFQLFGLELLSGSPPASGSVSGSIGGLIRPDPAKQESLMAEAEVDPLGGEQTWPTVAEMEEAETRRVPRGTSEYQAAWVGAEVDGSSGEGSGGEGSSGEGSSGEGSSGEEDEWVPTRGIEPTDDVSEEAGTVSSEEETMGFQLESDYEVDPHDDEPYERYKQERLDSMFPDEVDTPRDIPARVRFAKFRGLKSFRTSHWDPKENLPSDYSRIFEFDNFTRFRRHVVAASGATEASVGSYAATVAAVGSYVTIYVDKVPRSYCDSLEPQVPLVTQGLLPHERKMSVVNLLVKRTEFYKDPIRSKESMIFVIGGRRLEAAPIYSQHTLGNKHKLERFFRAGDTVVATLFAPVTFPPAPVLMFKPPEEVDGGLTLVASGSVLSVDPDRVVVKRLVLSGHPFKVNKRHAVVRYMFFNPADINWFKPVELRTKWGRRGHIAEPLGTHGHMKCLFDKQLSSQDTVLMNLYKRVYPKWNYNSSVASRPIDVPNIPSSRLYKSNSQLSLESMQL